MKALDDQVGKTGGGMGNLKKAAIGGGLALAAVGVKSVLAFEDLGLTVGKFADATGTTKEQASRLIEVGDDLGISSDTLQSSIGKMEKQLGTSREAFKQYGVQVATTKDGTVDANGTFLNAVDAINAIDDPLKKAEASAKIFGKGYQGMSELLSLSSDTIKTKLAAVEDQKIFDDEKVQKARDMREAFDSIKDAGEDLLLTIGSALAPVIKDLAPTLKKVIEAAGPLATALGKTLAAALEAVGPIIENLLPVIQGVAKALGFVTTAIGALKPTGATKDIRDLGVSFDEIRQKAIDSGISLDDFNAMVKAAGEEVKPTGDGIKDAATAVENLDGKVKNASVSVEHMGITAQDTKEHIAEATASSDELTGSFEHMGLSAQDTKGHLLDAAKALAEAEARGKDAQRATDNLTASWEALKGSLSDEQSWIDVENGFADVKQAGIDAMDAAKNHTEDADQKARDYQSSLITLKEKVIDYAKEVGGLPPEEVTRILAEIDSGSVTTANQILDEIAHSRQVIYNAQVGAHREFAQGGTVPGPKGAPMWAVVHGGEQVISNADQANGTASGGPVNVTINMPPGSNGDDVVRAIKKFEARNGPGWRS